MENNKNIFMLICDVQKIFHNHMRKVSDENNIVNCYRPIVFFLSHHDGMTQLDIVKKTRLKAPTISLALRKMEQEGLVERRNDKDDARKVCVYLTDAGYAYDEKMKSLFKNAENQILSKFNEEDKREMERVLLKLLDVMCQEFGEYNEDI